jgi:hypothetical protein
MAGSPEWPATDWMTARRTAAVSARLKRNKALVREIEREHVTV